MEEYLCNGCGEDFAIISDTTSVPEFCPFCGGTELVSNPDEEYNLDDE